MKTSYYFIICFLLGFENISQAEIWITRAQDRGTAAQDRKFVEDFRKDHIGMTVLSAFDALQNEEAPNSTLRAIADAYQRAEVLFFDNKFAESEKEYFRVLQSILNLPYKGEIARILMNVRIRLAQISKFLAPEASDNLWKQAVAAHWNTKPDNTFSPDVHTRWKKTKAELTQKLIPLTIQLPSAGLVYLNGRRISVGEQEITVPLAPGTHHVAVLLPHFKWWIKAVEVGGPHLEKVSPLPLASGSCEGPQYFGQALARNVALEVLFENGCWRTYKGGAWVPKPIQLSNSREDYRTSLDQQLAQPFENSSRSNKLFKSPWFWVVSAAIVGGVYWAVENQKPVERVPVHTGD